MSAWSDSKAATASRLITKRGLLLAVERPAAGNQSASGDRPAPILVASARGVFLPGNPSRILLEATATVPRGGDLVTVPSGPNAGVHRIAEAKPLAPDGGLIYTELTL